jgi:sugar lactone lactonase YvrE
LQKAWLYISLGNILYDSQSFIRKLMKSIYYPLLFGFALSSFAASAQEIATFAGTGAFGYAGNGDIAQHAQFNHCTGVAFDGAGSVYIADRDNNVVRKVSNLGIITTIAGTGTAGYSGDGAAATTARLKSPTNVAVDGSGNVFISDNGNSVVRKVTSTGLISTYAGNGAAGYSGDADSANAAALRNPLGLAFDDVAGVLYIADAGNHVVRMVDGDHIINTVIGTGIPGNTGDGDIALNAHVGNPSSVAVDAAGNVYVADNTFNVVRKVMNATGVISTVAGNGVPGYSGNGGAATAATLHYPSGIAVDGTGNIFVADQGNNVIREITPGGIIFNVAGNNTNGYLGDGGTATMAELNSPGDVAVDGWGRIYISDNGNNVVRSVTNPTAVNTVLAASGISVYPNPVHGSFTVNVEQVSGDINISVVDVVGRVVATRTVAQTAARLQVFDTKDFAPGVYFVKVAGNNEVTSIEINVVR